MSDVLKDRFKDEVVTISGYVDYIENNFYRRSCQVLRTQGFEDFEVLKDYVFFTDDEPEKENNRNILIQLGQLVKSKIEDCVEQLDNKEKVPLPQIRSAILDNDLKESLCEYLRLHVYDCMDNPDDLPYSKLIEEVSATGLKEQIDFVDEASGDKCYDMLNVEDYESILEFMRCTLHNEEIEETESELFEYQELQTLYGIFDEKAPINIYRQSFILLLTAFDAVVFDMAKILFCNKFFEIAPFINYDKKFSLADISKYENFEEFEKENPGIYHFPPPPPPPPPRQDDFKQEGEHYLFFGHEHDGIPHDILKKYIDDCVRIPMYGDSRSLNLSNTVAIGVYGALRQQGYTDLSTVEVQKGEDFLYNEEI